MSAEKLTTVEELQAKLLEAYRNEFSDDRPTLCAFAPGRVNLIGEHLDYNNGFVFPMAISVGTMVLGSAVEDPESQTCYFRTLSGKNKKTFRTIIEIACFSEDVKESKSFELDLKEQITPLKSPKWGNYVVGVLALFLERIKPGKKRAFRALIATSVPIGGGLSSSASIEVAMCTFLEALYQGEYAEDLQLSKVEKAVLCSKAEQTYAKVPCGVMDQYASCVGKANHALLIDCQDNKAKQIPIDVKDVCLLVTNSNVKHELTSGKFAENVQHCQDAAKLLSNEASRIIQRTVYLSCRA